MIWFNLTTTRNWNRPPVGIIRVEQSIFFEIKKILQIDEFKSCRFINNRFVKDTADITSDDPECFAEGDTLITMGLDWDFSFPEKLLSLKNKYSLRIITCIYDLLPILFPQFCVFEVSEKFSKYIKLLQGYSSGILCISENTKHDYDNYCVSNGFSSRPTTVLRLGDNIPDKTGEVSDEIRNLCNEPILLFVSTIERRKNHETLYQAYHILRRKKPDLKLPKLVFVGMPAWGVADLMKDIELDPLTQGYIVQLHHVTDAELNILYSRALFCLYPSFYEGWGLPVAEALAMGKAVISSSEGSLPEVGGDLVKYASPYSATEWANGISFLIENPLEITKMEETVQEHFKVHDWNTTASEVINFFRNVQI